MRTRQEASALLAAAERGAYPILRTRPDYFRLKDLIFPGSVIIYDSRAITRWRDGLSWSQPRMVNGFLTYVQHNTENGPALVKQVVSRRFIFFFQPMPYSFYAQLFTGSSELKLVSYQNVSPDVLPAPIVDPVHVSQPNPVCL